MGSGVFSMPKSVLNLRLKRIIVRIQEEMAEMKIGIMMRDTEYRDAMAEMISGYGKDIYVEIAGSGGVHNGAVILTDIMPSDIEPSALARLSRRTVFLAPVPVTDDMRRDGCHIIFKYSSQTEIMSELSIVYAEWTGDKGTVVPSTRIIAAISESDQICSDRCRALAGQILYTFGGTILLIPLGYINDYLIRTGADDMGFFRRLMFLIDEQRDIPADAFTVNDNYGISYLRLPGGINPIAGLSEKYLSELIRKAGCHFDTVIMDIGTCFRRENLKLLDIADNILFFGSGRRIGDLSQCIGKENAARTARISVADDRDGSLAMDDYVKELRYGAEKE